MADGKRGVRQTWPVAVVVGVAFAIAQWISATYISVELTDIIASLVGLAAAVVFLASGSRAGATRPWRHAVERERELASSGGEVRRRWGRPGAVRRVGRRADQDPRPRAHRRPDLMALFPYLLVIAVFSVAKLVGPVKAWLASTDVKIPWPGLDGDVLTAAGEEHLDDLHPPWLSSRARCCSSARSSSPSSTASPSRGGPSEVGPRHKMRFAFLTVASVLALAYVMNLSGQTITIGTWIAGTGAAFVLPRPILGWIGTAVTGSDTSANALFATLQQTAARPPGIDPTLLVAANTSGGVVGKMISPQNLTIAATAVGLVGRESDIFRKVLPVERRAHHRHVPARRPAVDRPGLDAAMSTGTSGAPRSCAGLKVALFATCFNDTMWPETPNRHGASARAARVPRSSSRRSRPAAVRCFTNTGYAAEAAPARARLRRRLRRHTTRSSPRRGRASGRSATSTTDRAAGGDAALAGRVEVAPKVYELSSSSSTSSGSPTSGPTSRTGSPTTRRATRCGWLRVGDRPLRLLRKAVRGHDLVELPGAEECCGFGGTFSMKNPDVSIAMGSDKARHVVETGAEVLVAGDNSCLMHIGGVLGPAASRNAGCTWPRSSPRPRRTRHDRSPRRDRGPRRAAAATAPTFVGMPKFPEGRARGPGQHPAARNLAHATHTSAPSGPGRRRGAALGGPAPGRRRPPRTRP
jgi:hypothetical protein